MKTLVMALCALPILMRAALPQDPAPATREMSEAEQAFRDGWWAENGKSDLPAALQRYLAAAQAGGPAALRAKALLHAGAVQARLGKVESAIATFRQLLREHPAETEPVEQARVHLRELTAVDLRQNYDEWYERRLFGEEVQVRILGMIENLASKLSVVPVTDDGQRVVRTIKGEIKAFGKGAVPALRKACDSPHEALAEHAVQLLFSMGVVPPVSALLRCTDWLDSPEHWELLLASPPTGVTQPGRSPHADLVRATQAGRAALVELVLSAEPPRALAVDSPARFAIACALLRSNDGRVAELVATATSDTVSVRMRDAFERALCQAEGPLALRAADWIRIGAEPLHHELSVHALGMAVQGLRAGDGDSLDAVLARLESAPKPAAEQLGQAVCRGLESNVSPLHVPWTAARLRRLFLAARSWEDACLADAAWTLRLQANTRGLLAEALLGDPVAVRAAGSAAGSEPDSVAALARHLAPSGDDEADRAMVASRWYLGLAEFLTGAWPQWNDGQRVAALQLLPAMVASDVGDRAVLRTCLERVQAGASEAVRKELDAVRERLQ